MAAVVSVIVPVYNYGKVLAETLECLLQQSFQDWECIIVDDGSTDNSAEVAKAWCRRDSRFRYIFQANAGLSAARNTGIRNSSGQFIQLLDADDLLAPGKFETQLRIAGKNPGIGIIYSEVRYFFSDELPRKWYFTLLGSNIPWMKDFSPDQPTLLRNLAQSNIMAVNCAFIRREVFHSVGEFNTRLTSLEDWEFWFRSALLGITFLYDSSPESMALVRSHSASMSRNLIRMNENAIFVRNLVSPLINQITDSQLGKEIAEINLGLKIAGFKELARLNQESGNRFEAFKYFARYCLAGKHYRHLIKMGPLVLLGKPVF